MLKFINIINLAVIHRLTFELGEGLCLLTGETGAGKSIIVDALGFLLGRRGGAELVRTGERLAVIEGGFELAGETKKAVEELLQSVGVAHKPDEELLIRRELNVSGQSRIFINDRRVTNATLRDLQPFLVEILGQGEHFVLTSRHSHLDMLDNFAGSRELLTKTSEAFKRWRRAVESLSELRRVGAERERLSDYLRFQLAEIEKVDPKVGEEGHLLAEKSLLVNVERVFELCSAGFGELYENDDSISSKLGAVRKQLQELAGIDRRVEALQGMLESASALLSEVAEGLRSLGEGINYTEGRLEEIENRLAEIQRCKRKFGKEFDELIGLKEELGEQLERLTSQEKDEEELGREVSKSRAEYLGAARRLSKKRHEAIPLLEKRVTEQLRHLALENARFEVRAESFFKPEKSDIASGAGVEAGVSTDEGAPDEMLSQTGADRVMFLFSANKGEVARPLNKVASGGELSRLMLALRTVCLGGKNGAGRGNAGVTLIFDEIDAGIGGKTAEAVGLRLRQLAESQQVLCVTHQPQIARFAEHHFVVTKEVEGGRTLTSVRELGEEERVGELARMIGGAEDIKAARATAKWMLENNPGAPGAKGSRAV
jgi:DNA repair protein RecN (Recombination protein N)